MDRQDARGVIPTNVETNIIAKYDLRTLHQMAEVRLCTRTQGEYQEIFKKMKLEVVKVHPWAENFINVFCVNHGTCCFPRYKECPIQEFTLSADTEKLNTVKDTIKMRHNAMKHSANPVAKNGSTM
jgi:thymidylate synthase ThyX